MILFILMSLGSFFLASSTPHILIASLLSSTLMSAIFLGMLKSFPWLAYILFLVFLGGILILFTYVSSLNSNPLFVELNTTVAALWTLFSASLLVSNVLPTPDTWKMEGTTVALNFSMKELFTPAFCPIYLYLFIYLLITLLYVVTIMKVFYAPLRSTQ
uniref:NADH dehydrogenase subunit 6 n=1 Tax=Proasellus coiffaiti TaxID=1281953 RepID=A0A485M9H8_9CRUS|nr:NADH dehydrogenase subunit 6 [Proasellus coiffaiti]